MYVYQEWIETNDKETYILTGIGINWMVKSLDIVDLSTITIKFIYKNNTVE